STSGYVSTLGGAAISWKSSKQTVIAKSTMESEFITLDKCGEEAEWLRQFVEDIPMWPKLVTAISIHCDSQSAIGRAHSTMYNGKSRHIHRRHNSIRQLLSTGVISIDYVKSKDNIADLFTKGLSRELVSKSSKGIGLKPLSHPTKAEPRVKSRIHRSRIDVIMNSDNIEVTGTNVADVFVSHYKMFLGSDMVCDNLNMDGLLEKFSADSFSCMIIEGDHHLLSALSLQDGIKEVVSDNQSAFVPDGKRGYEQGDPLSPYLFTLIMEVLTLMIKRRVNLSDSARVIMESLDEFKLTSGLVPSIPKSTAFFCNVPNHVKISILNIMPFAEGNLPFLILRSSLLFLEAFNKVCKVLVRRLRIGLEIGKEQVSFF
ncbi:hypothetical protein Tco_0580353, partial [Tanacetum coccineum]